MKKIKLLAALMALSMACLLYTSSSDYVDLVDSKGIEPSTSAMRTQRSPS